MEPNTALLKVQDGIWTKLMAVEAVSEGKAVTAKEARFDSQEQNWLPYIAGGLLAKVKKTRDQRYYITF
jgi:hypothetical protein